MQHAVIMAGGSGTRLWPKSRQDSPKQFQALVGTTSLLQQTYQRIAPCVEPTNIWVVTVERYLPQVLEQLPEITAERTIIEPTGRNTAPAIGLATLKILESDPEAVVGVLPSDHYIGKERVFHQAVATCFSHLELHPEAVLTIGINPTEPQTGYGYIKMGDMVQKKNGHLAVHRVESFVEKPDSATAQTFFESYKYLWNGGYYFFNGSRMVDYYQQFAPIILTELQNYLKTPTIQLYERIAAQPIDKAIAEKCSELYVVPANLDWSDIGNWAALHDIIKHQQSAEPHELNIAINSNNNLVIPKDKLIATVGLSDIVVVDTGDAILICHREAAQDLKEVIEQLRTTNKHQYL